MKNKLLRLVPLIFFLSLIGLNAATIDVPTDQGTLQDAVAAADPGDEINIEVGYTHNGLLTTINKNLTITGNNQSIDGGFDITNGAVVVINDLTITGIQTSGTNAGWSSHSTGNGGAKYIISVLDGKLTADNLTIDQTYPFETNLTGFNVRKDGELDLQNSDITLSGEGTIYCVYGQQRGPTISVTASQFNGEILETNAVGKTIVFIGFAIMNHVDDGAYVYPTISHNSNTYNPVFSESDQRFFEFRLTDLDDTETVSNKNDFIDPILTSGEFAQIDYSDLGYLVYGLEKIVDNASPGDIINLEPGDYFAIEINTENVTLVGTAGVYIYNGSPAITINADDVTLDGLSFNFDSADYAIDVDGDYSGIVVKNCNFFNTDGGGVNPGLGIDNDNEGPYYVLAYENNDWGDASGPTHASNPGGTGVTITDYVIYEWEGLQEPIHSITGVSIEPTFVWGELKTGPAETIEYQLIISINSDLSAPLFDENVGTVLTYNTNENIPNFPLENNTKYYWQVIALDGNSDPIFESEVNFFTTVTNVNISLYNPGNGIKLYAYDPAMFTWGISQSQGALKYYLQIKASGVAPTTAEWFADVDAEITTPGSIDFFYDHQSNSWKNVNGLDGGTRYYWRVVAYYDDGTTPNKFDHEDRVVKYSQVFYFDTEGGAVKAYPSYPTSGLEIYYLDPTFYWYTMQWEPGATFEVIYSDDPTEVGGVLSNPLGTISAGSNMYVYIGTDLDPSTQYYWQVETTYGIETNYSSIATFKTYDAPGLVPTAANPSYPTGGLEIYTTAPTFYWWIGAANTSVNFEVQVSTDNTFGVIDFTFGPTTDFYVQGSGLVPGEYYYWRVRSYVTGPDEVFSTPPAEFSVAGGLSSSVVLSWPVGNPTVYTDTPTLSWYVDGSTLGWNSFIVRWQKGSNSGNWATTYDGSYTTSDINETFYTFTSPLEYGETYYWAVALYDGVNPPAHGDFSYSSFTIAGNDANILLTNPANNSILLTKSPSFYWYVTGSMLGVTHFRVTYSNTELFNANVETVVTTTTTADVNDPLTAGSTYWWYVELSYDGDSGPWVNASTTWKFTVDPGASAVMPLVGSPARGVTIGTNSPTLSWYLPTQSQSALSYEVELSTNPDFSNATKYDNIAQLNSQVTDLTEGEYYWRVRSKTSGSTSSYSNTGNFKIGSVTSVEGEEELPLSYSIEQNYPNPFNPTTTINYSLPEANFVTIKIYNMLGQEVKTLLSEEVKAGRHNVNWNGENNYGSKVSSGTYVYRITAGEFVQAKKMILLK